MYVTLVIRSYGDLKETEHVTSVLAHAFFLSMRGMWLDVNPVMVLLYPSTGSETVARCKLMISSMLTRAVRASYMLLTLGDCYSSEEIRADMILLSGSDYLDAI